MTWSWRSPVPIAASARPRNLEISAADLWAWCMGVSGSCSRRTSIRSWAGLGAATLRKPFWLATIAMSKSLQPAMHGSQYRVTLYGNRVGANDVESQPVEQFVRGLSLVKARNEPASLHVDHIKHLNDHDEWAWFAAALVRVGPYYLLRKLTWLLYPFWWNGARRMLRFSILDLGAESCAAHGQQSRAVPSSLRLTGVGFVK